MEIAAIIALVILLLILLVIVVATFVFYTISIARQTKTIQIDNPNPASSLEISAEEAALDADWVAQQTFERWEIKSYDGLTLRAQYLPARIPTKKTVLLAHGYTSRALPDMGAFAQLYHVNLGFNVLMPDDRGHGESEGSYIGFGWHDRLDMLKWVHYSIQRLGEDTQIVLHGISMGGATVLMTGGERLPAQVRCIVSDCAYTSITEILTYQLKARYKLPPFPFVSLTSLLCKLRAGYFFSEGSTLRQVAKASVPILFIHGTEDTFVPTPMVHRLYDQCPTDKAKFLAPGAGHGLAYASDKASYTQQVRAFLDRFMC